MASSLAFVFRICSNLPMSSPQPVHDRSAQSGAVPVRFGLATREADGDWLDMAEDIDGPGPRLRTTVTEEHAKTIVSFNRSPDIAFDRSINACRGWEQAHIEGR